MIGALINLLATFIASYLTHFAPFLLVYGGFGGFGIGFAVI
jgi:hypothetical protein